MHILTTLIVNQGTFSGPKHFLVHINDLRTPCPIYKYVDDSTIFEICNQNRVQPTLLRSGLAIMICALIRVRQKKWLYVSVKIERMSNLWNAHVDEIVAKARKRVYMIYQLKRAGINQIDLVRIYVSVIRLVVEYACPVWHMNLPKYLSDNIEIIKKRCLKTIFPGFMYEDILQMVNIPTLHDRRSAICKAYFGSGGDHKLNKTLEWFHML